MNNLNIILFAIGVAVIVSAIVAIPVFLLWNGCLVGAIDGVHEITWLQGWGISLLIKGIVNTNVEFKK